MKEKRSWVFRKLTVVVLLVISVYCVQGFEALCEANLGGSVAMGSLWVSHMV